MRNLVVVTGDQLNDDSSVFEGFDRARDAVVMAEVEGESNHVWSHKARIAMFLSAMRHFGRTLSDSGIEVHYRKLEAAGNRGSLRGELAAAVEQYRPEKLVVTEPGEWRVRKVIESAADDFGLELDVRTDDSFYCSHEEFAAHAEGRKELRLEYFYRELRRRHRILMEGDKPVGGKWNFDHDNRGAFGREGPKDLPAPQSFRNDDITNDVLDLVERRFADHPGRLDRFDWPVTPDQAKVALDDFIANRLPSFGDYQDAMWSGQPWLYHSRLSAAMNLKLLDPRDAVAAAEAACHDGTAPLNAVEGFVRQILGWREYVRGIYWRFMPDYVEMNALGADRPLPRFYWTGETEMNCLSQVIGQTLETGYAHHIQRLMVTGLFALLAGVDPKAVHEWYLAVYVDAVEWVELPNSLGMSQYADGGIMASKPYIASGKYIGRMSNYCDSCRFDPAKSTGDDACPFTTLYWNFLDRHSKRLASNPRMKFQVRNLERKSADEIGRIRASAGRFIDEMRLEA